MSPDLGLMRVGSHCEEEFRVIDLVGDGEDVLELLSHKTVTFEVDRGQNEDSTCLDNVCFVLHSSRIA